MHFASRLVSVRLYPSEFRFEWGIYLGVALRAWNDRKEREEERARRAQDEAES
jgi:hypothetical protein